MLMLMPVGRLTNHERKATITEELLADPELSQVRKRRFNKLQVEMHATACHLGAAYTCSLSQQCNVADPLPSGAYSVPATCKQCFVGDVRCAYC